MKNIYSNEIVKRRLLVATSFVLVFITLYPLIRLAFYNTPSLWDEYFTLRGLMNGKRAFYYGLRFSTQFLHPFWFIPQIKVFNYETILEVLNVYHIASIAYILFMTLSFFSFLYGLNKYVFKFSVSFFFFIYSISLFLFFNFINASPEFFYCHTVTTGYTGGVVFMFVFLSVLIEAYFSDEKKRKIVAWISLFVITFILSGFIEFFVLFAGYISFYLFLFTKKNGKRQPLLFCLFLFCIVIFISFFFANFFATKKMLIAAKYEEAGDTLLKRIPDWFHFTVIFIKQEIMKIVYPTYFIPVIACLLFFRKIFRMTFSIKHLLFFLFLYPVILLMSFSGCYGGLSYFSLYTYPRNVFDVIFFLISIPALYVLFSLTIEIIKFRKVFYVLFIISTLLSVIHSGVLSKRYMLGVAWNDLISQKAKDYYRIQISNYKTLFSNSSNDIVYLEFPGFPMSIVTAQGNCILYNPINASLCADKSVVDVFKKQIVFYNYNQNDFSTVSYIKLKEGEGAILAKNNYFGE